MFDPMTLLSTLLQNNPTVANNAQAKNMLDVIRRGDSAVGEQIAMNLCNTYGISKDDAIKRAEQFFGIRM